jgi:RNA polymerase sigma factor (sigma-70 family)
MKPVSAPTEARSGPTSQASEEWRERAGRLYGELERPARAMVRRAFRGAFSDHELEDVYSSAWVGTLRALERRQADLRDEEIRKYVLTAVANQASKELRRRRRKPTAPLELVGSVPDSQSTPDELATEAERSRVTRDMLVSLPPRRRAVMLLRYGWGLEPKQVCELVEGLSRRAYRKEITRGIDDLTECMRKLETGDWCADREAVLKAYASGLADAEQRRQAEAHLSHCQDCSDFVGRLSGHLHDLGTGLLLPITIDGIDGHVSLTDRLSELGERTRESIGGLLTRGGGDGLHDTVGQVATAGGTRGAGAASAGILAKLAGLGTAGKVAVACLTGSAAATACIGAGVVPGLEAPGVESRGQQAASSDPHVGGAASPTDRPLPDPGPGEAPVEPVDPEPVDSSAPKPPAEPEPAPAEPEPAPAEPVAPSAPPVAQEFGVAAAAAPPAGSPSGSSGSSGGGGSPVQQEFGP